MGYITDNTQRWDTRPGAINRVPAGFLKSRHFLAPTDNCWQTTTCISVAYAPDEPIIRRVSEPEERPSVRATGFWGRMYNGRREV